MKSEKYGGNKTVILKLFRKTPRLRNFLRSTVLDHILRNPYVFNFPIIDQFHSRKVKNCIDRSKIKLPAPRLLIENSNFCNAKCVMCPNSLMKRPRGIMEFSLFRKIVDEAVTLGIEQIQFAGMGESFMDRGLLDKITYAKQKGIPIVDIYTNGSLLEDYLLERLFLSGLDRITISMADLMEEPYTKVMVTLPFKNVCHNIINFLTKRKERGLAKPEAFIVVRNPQNGKRKIKSTSLYKYLNNLADFVEIPPKTFIHDWGGQGVPENPINREYARLVKRNPCVRLWKDMNIFWDGRVALCCIDFEGVQILGDLMREKIRDVWEGSISKEIRKIHEIGNFDKIPLCASCSARLPWWLA